MTPALPKCREDLVIRVVDEDFVVYDPISDRTTLLNKTAAVVFDLCDGTRDRPDIVRDAALFFGIEHQQIREDIEATIENFAAIGFFGGDASGPGDT